MLPRPDLSRVLVSGFVLAGLASLQARAAQSAPTYPRVAIHTDEAVAQDASLQAFVARLRTAVAAGDLNWVQAALARNFAVITCSGGSLAPCAPGAPMTKAAAGATPADRLRTGLTELATAPGQDADTELDDAADTDEPQLAPPAAPTTQAAAQTKPVDTLVIGQLASLLETTGLGSHPDVPGAACLPAWPLFDRVAAKKVLAAAGGDEDELRVATLDVPVYSAAKLEAPVLATLHTGDLVPLSDTTSDPPPGWSALRLPDGRLGFAEDLGLDEIDTTGPCFVRENGAWKISFLALRNR